MGGNHHMPRVRGKSKPLSATPLVSVIIPVYNAESTLRACIESVLVQDYPRYEIIAIDDCSKDGSKTILESFGKKIRVLALEKNQGAAAARNAGFQQAKGDIILLLDSDAKVFPRWIAQHVARQAEGRPIVGGSVVPWDDTFWGLCDHYSTWYEYYPQKSFQADRYQISSTNLSIHSSVIQKIGLFDTRIKGIEDAEYTHRMREFGFTIAFDPTIQMAHHDREGFISFLRHHYGYGYHASIVRRKEAATRFSWLMPQTSLRAAFMLLPLAVLHTGFTVYHWLPARLEALFFSPFIFLAKIAHAYGIYAGLRDGVLSRFRGLHANNESARAR